MQCATLTGSHNGREFVLEVSGRTWDRFRTWRIALDSTTGALLASMADCRSDPSAEFCEFDVNQHLDVLTNFAPWVEKGEEVTAAPNTA